MSEPRTVTGATLALFLNTSAGLHDMTRFIVDIEAEAAALERERLRALDLATFLHDYQLDGTSWHPAWVTRCDPAHHRVDAERIIAFLTADEPTP